MRTLRIFTGNSHPELAAEIANALDLEVTRMDVSRFACNEIYAKPVSSVRGDDVFLVQTCTGNVNEDLMELFVMIDALKRSFAGKVTVVLPHFGYARQDRVASPREPITAKLMASLIAASGADHVVTVQLHSDQIQGFFPFPVDNLNVRKMFADYLAKGDLSNAVIVAPDAGAAKDASRLAKILELPLAVLTKERPSFNVAEVTSVVGDVKGKRCIIYDDMVDTAGSVCAAQKALIAKGAKPEVTLVVTHPVFSGPAVDRFKEAGFEEVIVANTIPLPEEKQFDGLKVLSVAPLLSRVIRSINENKSVTEAL